LPPLDPAEPHRKKAIVGDEALYRAFLAGIGQDIQRIGSDGTVSFSHANNSQSGKGLAEFIKQSAEAILKGCPMI